MKKITVLDILKMKADRVRIPVLTAYSYPMAKILDEAGVPAFIVGDSAGMVEAGYATTLPVTLEEVIYHTRAVCRGRSCALVISDMPFGSYQTSVVDARRSAVRLVKEGGAEAVKVEGGQRSAPTIKAIAEMDIPVVGHVGLTPQSYNAMGGYRVQGKTGGSAEAIMEDACAVAEAGAFAVVLEGIPASLAEKITGTLSVPTIGIGAGPGCDGQVLVVNDMLGMSEMKSPRYVKRYADLRSVISVAAKEYMKDVMDGTFPSKENSY